MTDDIDKRQKIKHAFLQACGNRCTLERKEAVKIFNCIWKKYSENPEDEDNNEEATKEDMSRIIEEINEGISKYDQEIRLVKHELIENKGYYVFATTTEASVNKHQKHYTEADINYFYLILKEIITNEDYCVLPIIALNLTPQVKVKTFTKKHAEELIDGWINLGYFINIDDKIYFGPKILTEYGSYFKRNFEDYIKNCNLCKNITYWGTSCSICKNYFHKDCIKKYTTKTPKCPSCKKPWQNLQRN